MAQLKRSQVCTQLISVLQELKANRLRARNELSDLNEIWDRDRPAAIEKVMQLQQRFIVLQRWLATLEELQFQLEN